MLEDLSTAGAVHDMATAMAAADLYEAQSQAMSLMLPLDAVDNE